MDIDALRLFVEVARRGNFAAVARDRNVEPSTVSRSMAALEADLGVRLFQRSTRRMALTEAGERYRERVAPLVDELVRAREEVMAARTGVNGTLRLTTSVTFGHVRLLPLLPQIREVFPRVQLELLVTDERLDLVAERVDLAIRLGRPASGDLVGVRLFDMHYRVCASSQWLASTGPLAGPETLRTHRCLLSSVPELRSRWRFRDRAGVLTEVEVHGDLVVSSPLALRDCAVAGMGPALLVSWLVAEDLAAGRLVDLFPDYHVTATDSSMAAWLLYPSRAHLPAKVRAMVDFLRPRLR
jgi:DNA-binding transcriptional LysR family regulator